MNETLLTKVKDFAGLDSDETFMQKVQLQEKYLKFFLLVSEQLVTLDDLISADKMAKECGRDLEDVLLDKLEIEPNDLGRSLENYYKIPYFGYYHGATIRNKNLSGLNRSYLKRDSWLPLESTKNFVTILIDDPNDHEKIQRIKAIFPKKELRLKVGLKLDITNFLKPPQKSLDSDKELNQQDIASLLKDFQSENYEALKVETEEVESSDAYGKEDSSIIRLVDQIILDAYSRNVSDIHIEPGVGGVDLQVRFRVDGDCYVYEEIPHQLKNAITSRVKIMANLDITNRRLPQDGKFKIILDNEKIEMRVATLPTIGGNEDVILRNLSATCLVKLSDLNMSERNQELLTTNINQAHGMVLVVGPTGSGKTTTLHSILDAINSSDKKIWTAEDPVEISQRGLRQLQINKNIGLDFPKAMRSFLRGDPDVIMVGEMRDKETTSMAIQAALTGHLVLSTLHTNSAPETITRMLNMGMDPLDFAEGLLLIVAQRLVKTLCKSCKEDWEPSDEELEKIIEDFGHDEYEELKQNMQGKLSFKKAYGCSKCENTGYKGRTGLYEFLEGTSTLKGMIMRNVPVNELREQASKDGMKTLRQDGLLKIFQGECDLKQVLAITRSK
jgi:type II secretory ATPase GspE/PulE/Tfp pilus assembly ATPase PilB-like protein